MKHIILIFTLLMISILSAQEWSGPINISNTVEQDYDPEFCIDNDGVLHCVWSFKIEQNYRKIYYSKSENDGETWSEPYSISQNNELWMASPKITSDSQNNLYITYTYNCGNPYQTEIYFVKFNGLDWSEPVSISGTYNGSNNSTIITDNSNRVYAFWFWFGPYGQIYYRYLDNDQWGEIICPYGETDDFYIICEAVVDSENNLHCVGAFNYSWQTSYDEKTSYYFFDYQNNNWQKPIVLGYDTCWQGCDIALDSNEYPHIVWRQYVNSNIPPNAGTLYSYFDGQNWTEPEIIVEDSWRQVIVIDNNDIIHLVEKEKYDTGSAIVHYLVYYTNINNIWQGIIIVESENVASLPKLEIINNKLYLIYFNSDNPSVTDIYFMKKDITTNMIEDNFINILSYKNISLSQNYPNPFNPHTKINFSLKKGGKTTLKIFNVKGQFVKLLIHEKLLSNDHSVNWDGKDDTGKQVSSGVYFYKLKAGDFETTKKMLLMK